jgi:hypothetical protein
MIALLTAACGDDSADDDSATDTSEASTAAGGTATTSAATTSGSGSTSSGSTSVTTSGSGESDSGATDGTTTGEPDGELEPLFGVPNHDDDDGNGNRDWFDYPFAGDNDLNVFVLPEWYLSAVGPDHTVELSLSGDLNQLRFWLDGQLALGDDGEGGQPSYTLSAADAASAFDVEFADFLTRATLTVRRLGPGGVEERVDEVLLLAAPMLLNHHSQTAERVWAVQANNNGAMLAAFQQALGDKFTVINVNDVWVQDELEWATAAAPGQRLSVAVDSIRNRPLDAFVKGLRAPDVEPMTWGVSGTKTSEDSFGNLEATPPLTAGGVDYPFGRVYYGRDQSCGPTYALTDHLDAQRVQAPIAIDTCWLCVGHVDEFTAFIADEAAPKGFRLLVADVDAAYKIIDALPQSAQLPRYNNLHGYASVGAIADDAGLRAYNKDVQSDEIEPVVALFKAQLDLTDADIIRIPSLFEKINNCKGGKSAAALIPGMINLTVANLAGEPQRLFIADPFFRANNGDQSGDPMIAAFRALMPEEYELYFVDDWQTYHANLGEVHCGTNVSRTPAADWWTDALHLLEE